MKSEAEIRERIKEIESDERLSYPSANIVINAPLALEQLAQETNRDMLIWVLGDKWTPIPKQENQR